MNRSKPGGARECASGGPRRTLVIAYGNSSRRDDAAGHYVVEELAKAIGAAAGVELVKAHQLDVVMAERVASQDLVIFIDASLPTEQDERVRVLWIGVGAEESGPATSHVLSPGELLAVAGRLYGQAPEGILVTIRGEDFSFGEGLSTSTRAAAAEAAEKTKKLLCTSDQ